MDEVDASNGVFITAEGLLMYLLPEESMGLITECARHFPGAQIVFDLPPVLVGGLTSASEAVGPVRYASA